MVTSDDELDDVGEITPENESDEARRERLMLPLPDRKRINPKIGLGSMVMFLTDLRHRGLMRDGEPAKETWLRLEPADLEKLDDIAETLEWFRMQRLQAKIEASSSRGRRR